MFLENELQISLQLFCIWKQTALKKQNNINEFTSKLQIKKKQINSWVLLKYVLKFWHWKSFVLIQHLEPNHTWELTERPDRPDIAM